MKRKNRRSQQRMEPSLPEPTPNLETKLLKMDWLIGCVALIHLVVAPFTKVEESFNLQACHDLLYNGLHLNQYDHLEFPGVVPRTFVGPIIVSAIAYPFAALIKLLGFSKFFAQYIVRGVLGLLVLFAWRRFRKQLQDAFGSSVTFWFTLVTASQFHFMYYLSRPLPNTFALAVALLAFSYWLEQRHGPLIWTCGIAVLIFRSELCLLLGPMLLADLSTRKLQTVPFLKYAIPAGFICLATTIAVDSLFWGRLLWPEGEVFWFNTYKNQSQNWGQAPFLWYWYSALPRALGLSLPLIPVGIVLDKRVQVLVTPAIIFVTAYSFLPHKELRFIIYVFPILNVAVARACHYFWEGREKSGMRQLFALGSALHLLGNISFTTLLLTISSNNYPGGLAMHQLHQTVPSDANVHVHIDTFAAQTGVSRFTQLHDHWKYNKTEKLKAGGQVMRSFTHMLVEAKSKYSYNLKHYTTSHEILNQVETFSHLSFNYQQFPPVKVRVKSAIFLLQNNMEEHIDWSMFQMEDRERLEDEEEEEEGVEQLQKEEQDPVEDVEAELKDEIEEEDVPSEDVKDSELEGNLDVSKIETEVDLEKGDETDGDRVEENTEEVEDTEEDDNIEKLLEPKLPDGGCFAPEGEPEILVAKIDSSEDDYADDLLQSKTLETEDNLEEVPLADELLQSNTLETGDNLEEVPLADELLQSKTLETGDNLEEVPLAHELLQSNTLETEDNLEEVPLADELLQSKTLETEDNLEGVPLEESVEMVENEISEEGNEGFCFDCDRTEKADTNPVVDDDDDDDGDSDISEVNEIDGDIPDIDDDDEEEAADDDDDDDSDILVNSEETDSRDRYLEEEGEEKQTVFVEMASHLDEDIEVSAKEFDSEPQITSPLLSDNNPDNVEHVRS